MKRKLVFSSLGLILCIIVATCFYIEYNDRYKQGFESGFKDGSAYGIKTIADALNQSGIKVYVNQNLDGSYNITVIDFRQGWIFKAHAEFHLIIEQFRNGILLSVTTHPMNITTYGKDQIEQLLGGNTANALKYHCCSNNETAVSLAWTALPDEINSNGLSRALATYLSTGTGAWNMTNTWTATGTQPCCLYGVCSESSGSNLCLAEQQGSDNRKNLNAGDTLKMTVQGSVS